MTGLAGVLEAHEHPGEILTVLGDAWLKCSCGERIDLPVSLGRVHRNAVTGFWNNHLATAVLVWLGETLAGDEVREAVAIAVRRGALDVRTMDQSRTEARATAAIAAVREALGVGLGADYEGEIR